MARAWCVTCRRMQPLADEYLTDEGDQLTYGAGLTRTYLAQPLECGHDARDGGREPRPQRVKSDPRKVAELVELQGKARANGAIFDGW